MKNHEYEDSGSSLEQKRNVWWIALAYCLPAMPLSAMGILFFVHLPKFHAESLSISLSIISLTLLISRFWDAITDPLIGYTSDRILSPYRRRPLWLLIGSCTGGGVFFWLCSESLMSLFGTSRLEYLLLLLFFFSTYTAAVIPYESWALEVFSEERYRTRLVMLREGSTLLGTILAGAIPVLLTTPSRDAGFIFRLTGLIIVSLLFITVVLAVRFVPAPERPDLDARPYGLGEALLATLQNKNFRTLLIAFCLTTMAAQIPAALILFFVEDVLRLENSSLYVLYYFIGAAIGFPGWLHAIKRVSKPLLWAIGIVLNTGSFLCVFFISEGDAVSFTLSVIGSGLGLGGVIAVPAAIQADLIHSDTEATGQRREGSFVGVWATVRKMAAALSVAGVLWVLGTQGYSPGEMGEEPKSELLILMRYLYCLVPCILNIASLPFIFPLQRNFYDTRSVS